MTKGGKKLHIWKKQNKTGGGGNLILKNDGGEKSFVVLIGATRMG